MGRQVGSRLKSGGLWSRPVWGITHPRCALHGFVFSSCSLGAMHAAPGVEPVSSLRLSPAPEWWNEKGQRGRMGLGAKAWSVQGPTVVHSGSNSCLQVAPAVCACSGVRPGQPQHQPAAPWTVSSRTDSCSPEQSPSS